MGIHRVPIAAFWLNMQTRYELDVAEDKSAAIRKQITPYQAA